MRDYIGIDPWAQSDSRLRRDLAVIDYFLRDLSRGMQRIQQGDVPDGSGTPIADVGDSGLWFKLLGRPNNQVGHGGTSPSGTLTLASTTHSTKGKIFFGNDQTSAFDELNDLFGIGTASPDAAGHFIGNPQPGSATIVTAGSAGDANYSNTGAWETQPSGSPTNMIDVSSALKDDDDATNYLSANLSGAATRNASCKSTGTFSPGQSYTVRFKARRTGAVNSGTTFSVALTGSDGILYAGPTTFIPGTQFTTSWAYYTDTVTLTSGGASGQPTNCIRVICANNVTEGTRVDCTYAEVTNVSGTSGTAIIIAERTASTTLPYFKTKDESDVTVTQITSTGKVSSTVAPQWDTTAATTGDLWVATDNDGNGDWTASSALASADFLDSVFRIVGSSDPTKKLAFEVDGLTAATTRTLTPPNADATIAGLEVSNAFIKSVSIESTDANTTLRLDAVVGQSSNILEIYEEGNTRVFEIINTGGVTIKEVGGGAPLVLGATDGFSVMHLLQIGGIGNFTADRLWQFPNFDADFVGTTGSQTLSAKTFNSSCIGLCSTAGTGFSLADTTGSAANSKRLRFVLSGASSNNHSFVISNTTTRSYTFGDASIIVAGSTAALTSSRVPFATTGGILNDVSTLTFVTDTLSSPKVAMSSLTTTRVPFATTAGLLIDSGNMTFATDTLSVNKVAMSSLTSTRVPFASTAGLLIDATGFTFVTDTLTVPKQVISTNLQVAGGAVLTALTAGVYTPTLTGVANVAASTAFEAQYLRVGNTVTVSGRADIDPTLAAVATILGISLPVASNLGANEDCVGIMNGSTGTAEAGYIAADTTNDRASAAIIPTSAANASFYFHFTYQVL